MSTPTKRDIAPAPRCEQHPHAETLVRPCEAGVAHAPHFYEHAPRTYSRKCWYCPGKTA